MAGVTVGNIEIQISSNAQNAISSLNKLSNATNTSSSSMKNLESNVKNISRATQTMSGSFNNVTSIIATSLGFGSLNQAINSFIRLATESTRNAISLIENYNLFTVSMKGASTTQEEYNANLAQGIDFQNQLNSAFGTAIMDSMRYQGFFRNLANSLGLSNDASMMLSENLTKLTYDLSSLYNTDFATMYSKLQSGLVGQTKPLRSIGVDVTQQTLQPTLYSLGINKKVTELTQAQKVMLRYIEILRQTTSAQGDMARTIETPANQLRILKDQWKELTMWLGTLFIGVLGKVLPYLNGIVMAFKNVFKYISDIFGFKLSDYQFATVSEDAGLIDDALNDAVDTSDELKKSLAGFDQLNVLSQDTSATSSLTEDLSITTALQNAMTSYDNLMGSVKTKASSISDSILSWLGFTKEVDSKTGDVKYKFDAISDVAFKNIADSFDNLWNQIKKFEQPTMEHLTIFYNDFIKPVANTFIGETIPTFINLVADSLGLFYEIYNVAKPLLESFYKTVYDLSKLTLGLFTSSLKTLDEIVQRMTLFIQQNPELIAYLMALSNIKPSDSTNTFWKDFNNALIEQFKMLSDWASTALKGVTDLYNMIAKILGMPKIDLSAFTTPLDVIQMNANPSATNPYQVAGAGTVKQYHYTALDGVAYSGTQAAMLAKKNADIAKLKASGSSSYISQAIAQVQAKPISYYADGGFPSAGQMFIAREAGPEMVGTIGGKSAVANNNDIVSAISQGVYNAMSSAVGNGNGQTVELIVDDMVFGRVVINSANKVQKNTNLKLETF